MDSRDGQLFLLRVFIGLDFIHHFAEKFGWLGIGAYQDVLHYFGTVVPYPGAMVLLAGLCEFGAFVGFIFGLFTRVAAAGTALYLLIALFAGHHDDFGFTWANPGGGWEFPLFWAFTCAGFLLTGGGPWSLDHCLASRLPRALRWLCA